MELYRRSRVPHLWLVDPELETVEDYELVSKSYRLLSTHRAGDEFEPQLFPGEKVRVDDLFKTQWKRHPGKPSTAEPKPIPEWIIPPDKQIGLEHMFLLGFHLHSRIGVVQ